MGVNILLFIKTKTVYQKKKIKSQKKLALKLKATYMYENKMICQI